MVHGILFTLEYSGSTPSYAERMLCAQILCMTQIEANTFEVMEIESPDDGGAHAPTEGGWRDSKCRAAYVTLGIPIALLGELSGSVFPDGTVLASP